MWCRNCYQDLPGTLDAPSGRIVCSRCQQPMQTRKSQQAARVCDDGLPLDEPATASVATVAPFRNDHWSQHVRHLNRELRRPTPSRGLSAHDPLSRRRLDPPQDLFTQIQSATSPDAPIGPPPVVAPAPLARSEVTQIVAWLIVVAGSLALAAGIAGIAWSLSTEQLRYWNVALAVTLGGQGTLILGLVLVASRLWRNSRYATSKLHDVQSRLIHLQSTADALVASRSGSAPAFYADLVRGSSPQVLLANLKGQLDQLATRVGSSW
jgi:hypothetical protein